MKLRLKNSLACARSWTTDMYLTSQSRPFSTRDNLFEEKDFFFVSFFLLLTPLHIYRICKEVTKKKNEKKTTNQSKACKKFDNVRPGLLVFYWFLTLCAGSCTKLMSNGVKKFTSLFKFSVGRSDFHSRFSNIVNGKLNRQIVV